MKRPRMTEEYPDDFFHDVGEMCEDYLKDLQSGKASPSDGFLRNLGIMVMIELFGEDVEEWIRKQKKK